MNITKNWYESIESKYTSQANWVASNSIKIQMEN